MCLTLCPVSLIPLEANLALQGFCTFPLMLLRSPTDLPEGGWTIPEPVASTTPCLAIFPLSFWEESSGGKTFLLESVAVLNCHLKATWAHSSHPESPRFRLEAAAATNLSSTFQFTVRV